NRMLVLGAIGDTGELRATAENLSSQQHYGVLSVTLVDRNLADAATAALWAQTEGDTRSQPKYTLGVTCYVPGLSRGMTVFVEANKFGLSTTLILRSLTIVIMAPDRTRAGSAGHRLKYSATLGSRPPDLVYTLRRMQRRPVQPTTAPAAAIAAGTIEGGDLAAGIAAACIDAGSSGRRRRPRRSRRERSRATTSRPASRRCTSSITSRPARSGRH